MSTEKKEYSLGEKKFIIKFDREACIGAAACCAAAPENWPMQEDGKPNLLHKEIGEDKLKENIEAAQMCPVRVIRIIDKKTGKQIAL